MVGGGARSLRSGTDGTQARWTIGCLDRASADHMPCVQFAPQTATGRIISFMPGAGPACLPARGRRAAASTPRGAHAACLQDRGGGHERARRCGHG
eukprot:scaffold3814_cov334-Prasinococcus_capsulatus_cf.AAC.1